MTDLIGADEASKILCINRRSVLHRVQAGTLKPAGKLPTSTGAYVFDRAEVEALAKGGAPQC